MITGRLIGEQSLINQMRVLQLTPAKRKTVLRKLGQLVRDNSKKRITQQQNLDGSRYASRRRTRNARQKMLRGMKRGFGVTVATDSVSVAHKNSLASRIAYAQQHGLNETMTAAKAAKRSRASNADTKQPTRIQARKLLAAGFVARSRGHFEQQAGKRIYVPGVRRAATVAWIQANLTRNQASAIVRSLTGQSGKSSWVLPGTSRSFLGVAPGEIDEMLETIFSSMQTA